VKSLNPFDALGDKRLDSYAAVSVVVDLLH
jgi:hypothetical protein